MTDELWLCNVIDSVTEQMLPAATLILLNDQMIGRSKDVDLLRWWDKVVVESIRDHGYYADPFLSLAEFEDLRAIRFAISEPEAQAQVRATMFTVADFGADSERDSSISSTVGNSLPDWFGRIIDDRRSYLLTVLNFLLVDHKLLAITNKALNDLIDLSPQSLTPIERRLQEVFVVSSRQGCSLPLLSIGPGPKVIRKIEELRLALAEELLLHE